MPRNPKELQRSRTAPPETTTAAVRAGKAPPHSARSQNGINGRAGTDGNTVQATSFAARFGRVILQHGVAAIPSALYHFQGKLGLTAQQVWFVSYILAHKWADALPHPSLNKMAECTGVDRRVLQYRCAELTNLGLLQIQPRYGERGDQDTNYFDFSGLFEQLETILLDEPAIPNPIRDAEAREGRDQREETIGATRFSSRGPLRNTLTAEASDDGAELDYSFLARYGRVLLRYGIATVPKAIFTHQAALSLTPQQVWFVCYILSFQWDTSLPYPSINKMAERTGYSKRQLLRIKDDLVCARYLEVVRRTSSDRGNDTNAYDFSLLFEAIRQQLQAPEEPEKAGSDLNNMPYSVDMDNIDHGESGEVIEEIPPQPAPRHRARPAQPRSRGVAQSNMRTSAEMYGGDIPVERGVTTGIAHNVTRGAEQQVTRSLEQSVTSPVAPDVTGVVTRASKAAWQRRSPGGQKPESPEIEARKVEAIHEDDSNQLSPKNKLVRNQIRTNAPLYSPYIAAVASDFSRELGDTVHEVSNIKQALNLWTDSGLGEQQFVDLMHEARKLTRKYQSRPTWDAMNNKMAYLFTTLRDLLAQATGA